MTFQQLAFGSIRSDKLQAKLVQLTQLERHELLDSIVRCLISKDINVNVRLGIDRYTLIGGKIFSETLRSIGKLEGPVNMMLSDDIR